MKRIRKTLLTVGWAAMLFPFALWSQNQPAIQLEAAIAREQTDGDLGAAIASYRRISDDNSAPRAVRAKALLKQAQAQERLGQQSQAIYHRIAREFGDQPAAAEARKKLAQLQAPGPDTMVQRKLELPAVVGEPEGAWGRPVTHGKSIIYFDSGTNALCRTDMAGSTRVALYQASADFTPYWLPSRDLSAVVLIGRSSNGKRPWTLVNSDGSGQRTVGEFPGGWRPMDWSWDNRKVLVAEYGVSGSRLLTVALADGKVTEVGHAERVPFMAKLAPDGRAVAFGVGNRVVSRIYVIADAGRAPALIAEGTGLLDWTKDGRRLAVSMERGGSTALHLITIQDGKAVGEPALVRYGSFRAGMTTADGRLVYTAIPASGIVSVFMGTLNEKGRIDRWQTLQLKGSNGGSATPSWSPDGKSIAYVASYDGAGQATRTVRIHNLETGEDKELYRNAGLTLTCAWPRAEQRLLCTENDRRAENTRLISIAVDSGQAKTLRSWPDLRFGYSVSTDSSTIYGFKAYGGTLTSWSIATGQEIAFRREPGQKETPVNVSPDGRWLVGRPSPREFSIRAAAGGQWRTFANNVGFQRAFSPDGEWFYYPATDGSGHNSFYRIASSGGTPERLGDFPTRLTAGSLAISPDGRKFVVATFDTMGEWWVLQNYDVTH